MAGCILCGEDYEPPAGAGRYAVLCPRCWSKDTLREYDRLESAKRQAQRSGLPATLMLGEWLAIVTDWRGLCAYCQESYYSAIDLYRPGEGLTASNTVPICRACSVHKSSGWETAIGRVAAYVDTLIKQ